MGNKKWIDRLLASGMVVLLGLMVINVSWQVLSRYVFNSPSPYTDELARYLMIWLGFLGAAYLSGQSRHLSIDLLGQRMNEQNRKKLQWCIALMVAIFSLLVLVIGGGNLVYITHSLDQRSSALKIPLSAVYIILPLSGLLIMYYSAVKLVLFSKKH